MAAARIWHTATAGIVVVALLIQLWVAVFDVSATPAGHAVGALAGANLGGRLLRLISFFTIESNILSGVVSGLLAARPARDGRGFRVLRLASLFGIAVTGVVYSTVLAKVHEPHGWKETLSNALVHYVVPLAMVLGWFAFGPRPRIVATTILKALVWPLLYFGYILIFGAITHWYPYPFLNVAGHGYAIVVLYGVAVTAVFGAVAAVFWFGDRTLPAAPRT